MSEYMLEVARRNLRQYLSKASFSSEVDRKAAINCLDVIEEALNTRHQPNGGAGVARCDFCGSDYTTVACCRARYDYLTAHGEKIGRPVSAGAEDARNTQDAERIAALLYEEATDEPWKIAGIEHEGPDREYYRSLARRVMAAMSDQNKGKV